MEDSLEYLIKGTLVIAGIVLAMVAIGFIALVLLPFVIGYGIAILFWKLYDAIRGKQEEPPTVQPITPEESAKMFKEIEEKRRRHEAQLEFERRRSEEAIKEEEARKLQAREDFMAKQSMEKIRQVEVQEPPHVSLNDNLYLERKLKFWQREELIAKGYLRLKISPFGDSGASYWLVKTRYNESKEHAFFCYLLEHELKQYTKRIVMNTNYGPDLVVEFKGKTFAFDVETGKSLTRQPDYLERKFGHYERDYDQIFIFVTDKAFKYKYSRFGYVITRGKLREVLAAVFQS